MSLSSESIWIIASLVVLLVLFLISCRYCLAIGVGLINPVTVYLLVWFFITLLYNIRIISFNEVGLRTWSALVIGHIMFTLGAIQGASVSQLRPEVGRIPLECSGVCRPAPRERYMRLMLFYFIVGIGIFIIYLKVVSSQYGGILNVVIMPGFVRAGISEGEVVLSYKYIYILMPLSVISGLYLIVYGRSVWALLILVVSLLSSVATTGRLNFIWCLVWIAFAAIYTKKISRIHFGMVLKSVLLFSCFVAIFVGLGNWLGKSYENFDFGGEHEGISRYFVLPYLYLEGSIPALQRLIEEQPERHYGMNTFLPIVKIYSTIKGSTPPSEIEESVDIPYSFNTFTYLSPSIRDFGLLGTVFMPLIYGFVAMYIFVRMWTGDAGMFSIYLCSLVSSMVVFSFKGNHSISFATWMFILSGYVFYFLAERSSTDGGRERWLPTTKENTLRSFGPEGMRS